jgi:hypothetical protein
MLYLVFVRRVPAGACRAESAARVAFAASAVIRDQVVIVKPSLVSSVHQRPWQ